MLDLTGFKFCPRCGNESLNVFLENGFKCVSCGFIYFHNTAAAVAAIIEFDDKILLTRRAHDPCKGGLDLPGGFVDRKETLETALRREIKEELDLDLESLTYFGSFSNRYDYESVFYYTADAAFVCKPFPGMIPKPNNELMGIEFLTPEEIDLEKVAFVSIRNCLKAYLESR